ncbi:MAG: DUF4331 family protein [Gemmatimonadetes bacterium]|nr:DUF4331 family protein [Gemmatimonadota bacterium]
MLKRAKSWGTAAALAVVAVSAACDRESGAATTQPGETAYAAVDSTFSTNPNLRFRQVERLANPLVMEVFVEKREHDAYNTFSPRQDAAHFTDDIVAFITGVAKRDPAYAAVVAGALVGTTASNPGDKLTVFTSRATGVTAATMGTAANVGWLTYVLDPTGGYGGRKLMGDDVVDKGTAVVFGNVLGNNVNVSPGLVGDNVDENDKAALTTFPYFPAPTNP